MSQTQICVSCGVEKPADTQYFIRLRTGSLSGTCRDCVNARRRERYHNNENGLRDAELARSRKAYQRREVTHYAPQFSTEEEKTCSRCGETKSKTRTFFYTNSRMPDGIDYYCIDCRREA